MLPYSLKCWLFETYTNFRFDHNTYQLRPSHRILSQHPFFNDILGNRILSGTVVLKSDIDRFTENGVVFIGENHETSCEVVILATGYKTKFPFISQDLIPTNNNEIDLYKWVFSPKLKHPKTLAFISLVQSLGAIIPVGEQQSRWFAQLMSNRVTLPDSKTMEMDIEKKKQWISRRYYRSERHTIQDEWIEYLDAVTEQFGAKPNLLKYFFTDNKLWRALYFGPSLTYQYRLEGPHRWSGAKEAILTANERISGALKTRYAKEVTQNVICFGTGINAVTIKFLLITIFIIFINLIFI